MNAWLLDLAVLTTVLLAAALFLRIILRDPRSRVRLAWCTWLGIATAALVTLLPGWPRYDFRALGWPATGSQPDMLQGAAVQPLPVAGDWAFPIETGPPVHLPPSAIPPALTLGELALLTWLSAAALALAWIILGAWQARRLLRRSLPAPNWLHAQLVEICGSGTSKNASPPPFLQKNSSATSSASHPCKSVFIRGSTSSPFRALSCFSWPFRSASLALSRFVRAVRGLLLPTSDVPPDLQTSAALSSAVALRAHKPAILLPHASINPFNLKTIRAALAHEWAHICHGDLWLLALERLLLPLLALHPLFWLLRRSTRLDQELLADAAAAGDTPVEYAEALVAWAKTSAPPPAALAALAFWDRPSNLTRRVHMILHKPRSKVTWFSRVLSFAALACLIVLVGGLSLVTLRPLEAEDETKQPAPVVEHPIGHQPASPPNTSAAQRIELACIFLEVEPAELAQALAGGEHPPLPSPMVGELSLQTNLEWSQTRARLTAKPGTRVVSSPRLRTFSNQHASFETGVQFDGRDDVFGLKVELRPELLPKVDNEQQLLLSIAFERTVPANSDAGSAALPTPMKRKLQTKVAVPLGKVVVVTDPSNRSDRTTRMLLAIEPRLVAEGEESKPANPFAQAKLSALTQRLSETQAQLAKSTPADDSHSHREAVALRHSLLRLQREIAMLLDESLTQANSRVPTRTKQSQTPPAVSVRSTTVPKKATSNRLTRVFKVKPERSKELAEKLMRGLTEFGFAENVRISPDAQTGAIVVQGDGHAMNFASEFLEALSDESQTAAPQVTTTPRPAASPNRPALEHKLLELDLREAELGLQVAKAEHEQMVEIRKKNPAALSDNELRHYQLKVDLAQVKVERVKVRLEAFQSASPPPTPANPKR